MSLTIPDAFRQTFADSFRDVVQQSKSRLRKAVRTETGLTGISKQIETVDTIDDEETTGQRFGKTNLRELGINSRWYYRREFDLAIGRDKWDEKKLAPTIMPGGKIIQAQQAAFNRRCDLVIMENLLGSARTGKTGETATPLPSDQIVPVDFVHTGSDTDSGLTVPKIIEAVRILKANDAWNEERREMGIQLWGVLDSTEEARLKQQANLASGDRLFSKDYDPPEYDAQGTLVRWLGVNWISYEGLLTGSVTGASTTVTAAKCAIWTSDAMEFGIWDDFSADVSIRNDLKNAVQFFSAYALGAGREAEEKVVQINCLRA